MSVDQSGKQSTKPSVQKSENREWWLWMLPRGATWREILYAIARNQSEITEIWLEIRNQGLENPVEIRKSARNHEKWKKSREIRKSSRNHERILSEHAQYTFRACAFEKSTRKSVTRREINRLDLEITEIRKSRTPRSPCRSPRSKPHHC